MSAENDVAKSNTYLPKDCREKRDKKRLEREIVVIPKEFDEFDQDITMTIYGNKVAFIDFGKENSVIIENAMIAGFQKKLFTLLYKKLREE